MEPKIAIWTWDALSREWHEMADSFDTMPPWEPEWRLTVTGDGYRLFADDGGNMGVEIEATSERDADEKATALFEAYRAAMVTGLAPKEGRYVTYLHYGGYRHGRIHKVSDSGDQLHLITLDGPIPGQLRWIRRESVVYVQEGAASWPF